MNWELVAGAAGTFLALVFGLLRRKDRRKGDEARALLGQEREDKDALKDELDRRGIALETPSERRASALADLESRGLSVDGTGTAP